MLDCIFSNEENMVDNIHCWPALGKSDHVVISFQFNCYISANSISKKLNYAKGNYPEIFKGNTKHRLVSKISVSVSVRLVGGL